MQTSFDSEFTCTHSCNLSLFVSLFDLGGECLLCSVFLFLSLIPHILFILSPMTLMSLSTSKLEAALGRRYGVAQHRATAWCGGWFVCHVLLHVSTHIFRRVMCASRLWVHGCNEERGRAAALINAWISVEPSCSRQCPQTCAGVWHRARPQQRPGVHEGGALTTEAGDMWVYMHGPLLHVFRFVRMSGPFMHPVTPKDLAVTQHFKDRCA